MPVYNFTCGSCSKAFRRLFSADQFAKEKAGVTCPECKEVAEHAGGAPTTQAMEVLDDGLRATRLERYADAERIFKERSLAHSVKYNPKGEDE